MTKFLMLCIALALCTGQNYAQTNDLKALVGTTWLSTDGTDGVLKFISETNLSGYDGCNNYKATCSFTEAEGFQLTDLQTTERECAKIKIFNAFDLNKAKSFRVKRRKLTFFDKDKKVFLKMKQKAV